jgi:hypothetical protein
MYGTLNQIMPHHVSLQAKIEQHSMSANGVINGQVVEFKKSLADLKLKDRQYSTWHKIHYSHEE